MCPRLAGRGFSWVRVLLIMGEAISTAAGRFYRGNVVYHQWTYSLPRCPNPQVVDLNSTSCLTTSIIGLSVETSRSPRDLEAERMGLLDSFSQGGITCSVIHYEDHKADSKSKAVISILVQLPNLLGNGRAIVVHEAARQELGLEIKEAASTSASPFASSRSPL